MLKRTCAKCTEDKELTEDNFYKTKPTPTHPKAGWHSYCRICWKLVNKLNKDRIKADIKANIAQAGLGGPDFTPKEWPEK